MAAKKKVYRQVPADLAESFKRLVPADRLMDMAKKRKEAEAAIVCDEFLKTFAEQVIKNHYKPANPDYAIYDENGRLDLVAIFQVQNKFKYNLSEREGADEMGLEARFVGDLVAAGLVAKKMEVFVQNELHIYASTDIRNLDELIFGKWQEGGWVEATDVEKQAGEKLRRNLMADEGEELYYLTPEEREVAVVEKEKVHVRPGFWERIHQSVETAEQLRALLRIVDPTYFCSHMKYGQSDTPELRNKRLGEEANKLIGLANGKK